jgi:ABC-type transport system substrate-binding protein
MPYVSGLLRPRGKAVSTAVAAVIIVILVVAVAAGIYYVTSSKSSTTSSTTSTTSAGSITSVTSTTTLASSTSTTSTTSIASTSSSSTATQEAATLTVDDASFPSNNLNVLIPTLTYPNWMEWDEYQPLVSVNVSAEYAGLGYQLEPGLALNWTTSADGQTVTFNLRHGVDFSNGDPFNSYEVWMNMYNVYYSLSAFEHIFPFLRYPGIFNYSAIEPMKTVIPIINASGLASPNAAALAIMGNSSWPIYTNGPYQIVYHMDTAFTYLPDLLVGSPGMIYDAQVALDHGWPNTYGSPAMAYFNQNILPGTGPYIMTSYVQNSGVTFQQNPTYWGANLTAAQVQANPLMDPGHVKTIYLNYKPDDLSRYTDLSSGNAQIATIQSQDFQLVSTNPTEYGWVTFPSSANIVQSVAFNTHEYPMNITDVRLAIEHAINLSVIYQNVYNDAIHPIFGPETPGYSQYYDLGGYTNYSYNVTLAKQLLASADIKNFPTLTFAAASGYSSIDEIMQIIQSQLSANLGITVQIQESSYPAWDAIYSKGAAAIAANDTGYPDMTFQGMPTQGASEFSPADNWVTWTTYTFSDYANWETNNTVALVNAMDNSNNQTQILALMKAAQADVYNDAPYIWIGVIEYPYGDGSDAWQKSVISNAYFDPFWGTANTMVVLNTVTFTPQYLASHGVAASPRSTSSLNALPAFLLPGLFVIASQRRWD